MHPAYEQAASRFLILTGVACLIASIYIGPVAGLVWIVTAITVWRAGRMLSGGSQTPPSKGSCRRKRKNRR